MKSFGLLFLLLSVFVMTSKADNKWYDPVTGFSQSNSYDGYAGVYGVSVTGLMVQGSRYRVHIYKGGWLDEVDGFDPKDHNRGYAGTRNGDPIDAIAVSGNVRYAVHLKNEGYWLPIVSDYNLGNEDTGFAGWIGHPIDAVMIEGRKYATAYHVDGNSGSGSGSSGSGSSGNGNKQAVGCNVKDDMSLFKTNLTKQQFINAVQNSASYYSGLYNFSNRAGTIYDISVNNGINPELVVARAIAEGFAPGSSHNNYWGLNCLNGQESYTCAYYSSFEEGVKGFINNIISNGYQTPADMMKRYVYIGDYWFNPGTWGAGGCIYFDYIEKYYTNKSRASTVRNVCKNGGYCEYPGYGNCVRTNEEDQLAYSKYASQTMIGYRNDIFC